MLLEGLPDKDLKRSQHVQQEDDEDQHHHIGHKEHV